MKKTIKIVLLILFVGLSSYITLAINKKKDYKEKIAKYTEKMPSFKLNSINNSVVKSDNLQGKKTLIIFYSIDCDFCEAEAVQLEKNKSFLTNTNIIMISSDEKDKIESFKKEYNLTANNYSFCQDKDGSLMEKFGIQGTPITFIYNEDKDLLKRFNGSTHFKNIKKYLN